MFAARNAATHFVSNFLALESATVASNRIEQNVLQKSEPVQYIEDATGMESRMIVPALRLR
jgi:hypothetical protein